MLSPQPNGRNDSVETSKGYGWRSVRSKLSLRKVHWWLAVPPWCADNRLDETTGILTSSAGETPWHPAGRCCLLRWVDAWAPLSRDAKPRTQGRECVLSKSYITLTSTGHCGVHTYGADTLGLLSTHLRSPDSLENLAVKVISPLFRR